jgi:hypothetical protein
MGGRPDPGDRPAPSPADPYHLSYEAEMYAAIPRRAPLAVHFYPRALGLGTSGIASEWHNIKRIAAGRPIWVTEVGFAESQYGARGQARLTTRAYRYLASHGAWAIIVYRLQDADDRGNAWLSSLGMLTTSGHRKPAYHALRRTVRRIAGSRPSR